MKIAVGSDHGGYGLKVHFLGYLKDKGYTPVDFGADSEETSAYPVYGKSVGEAVAKGECELGILFCGTGVGISIAANKVKGVRAAVCSEPLSARLARQHNNANVICMGGRVVGVSMAEMIVDEFLGAEYEGGRHQGRIDMIE